MDNNNYSNGDYTAPEFGSGSGDGSDNSQYNTSGEYTSGQYNAYDQYGTSGQYNANAQYNTNGQYGADNQYNMNGQYYANGQYNQAGQYNMNGQQYQYNNGYGQGPVDNNGRPIPNNFGMKLTFSILITIFLSKIFGILSIVFSCLQNKAYKEGRWDDFKNKRKLSNVFLWIGLILGIIMFVVSIVFAGAIFKEAYNAFSDYEYSDDYDYDYDYDYDDSDDSDYDFDYDDASDTDLESDYVYGNSTFDFDAVEDMTINGAAVSVPMSVTDFVDTTGYDTYIEMDLDSYDLSGHNGGEFAYIDDENGCSLIDIYNGSDDEAKAIDSTIGGIKLDFEDTSAPIQFEYRGITNDSSIDDVLDVFGEADTRYNGEYSTELTYYTTNGWLEFDWDTDGKMISIWLENYGETD
ncbi:MAG: hypothetical protein PUE83_02210 [Lachnobacterium sp.]|nr:hypothetical protein [Lachnobacterium sp.]